MNRYASGELFSGGGKDTVEDLIAKHAVRDSAPGQGARYRRELEAKLEVDRLLVVLGRGEDHGRRRSISPR